MRTFLLRTGIPSVDELFRQRIVTEGFANEEDGILLDEPTKATSFCIFGPDGTGKSVLAMHMASRYLADCQQHFSKASPKVLYVSTDLNFTTAETMWKNFGLHWPNRRRVPFKYPQFKGENAGYKEWFPVPLKLYFPDSLHPEANSTGPLAEHLLEDGNLRVAFVDLASQTAGDDWGFATRLLAMLSQEERNKPRHLVVIDSIEGLQTFSGDLDGFGGRTSRRSRIAQLMRIAVNKCHLVLICEEPAEGTRLPEQFVSDAVLHLRSSTEGGYARRTLEIEKARGQSHIRGRHPYAIRSGNGSRTGRQMNYDDPELWPLSELDGIDRQEKKHRQTGADQESKPVKRQSYVHVFRSLHHTARSIMEDRGPGRGDPHEKYAAFGIPHLDDTLGESQNTTGKGDCRGLPCGTVTVLIGEPGTLKSGLGMAFLGQGFAPALRRLVNPKGSGSAADDDALPFYKRLAKILCRSENLETANFDSLLDLVCRTASKDPSGVVVPATKKRLLERFATCDRERDGNEKKSRLIEKLGETLQKLVKSKKTSCSEQLKTIRKVAASYSETHKGRNEDGVSILITTQDEDSRTLSRAFLNQLQDEIKNLGALLSPEENKDCLSQLAWEAACRAYMESRTICRRLEVRDTPPAVLFHTIRRAIEAAQQIERFGKPNSIGSDPLAPEASQRFENSWKIRLVIDDFRTVMDTHKQVREDPLFLPALIFHLGREGVTSLIIETAAGRPDAPTIEAYQSELLALAQWRLYTWRVDFFGDKRVAIAAIPPLLKEPRVLVRELRREPRVKPTSSEGIEPAFKDRLVVDPDFELYSGLERNEPHRVPLQISLYAETEAFQHYYDQENALFARVFAPVQQSKSAEICPDASPSEEIIQPAQLGHYAHFRDFCYLQKDTRLDHTFVFQVDEFWSHRGTLRSQWNYLQTVVTDEKCRTDWTSDPYGVFPKFEGSHKHHKIDFFNFDESLVKPCPEEADRVPFMWDFGFLALRETPWLDALNLGRKLRSNKLTIKDVWETCKLKKPLSWRDFLEAAKDVSQSCSVRRREDTVAFDLAMPMPETFSCLVLEIWLSEIYQRHHKAFEQDIEKFRKRSWKPCKEKGAGLLAWLTNRPPERGCFLDKDPENFPGYTLELYMAWLLLIEVLKLPDFKNEENKFAFAVNHKAHKTAVAARHWYKTATAAAEERDPADPVRYCRLPGHFSVRGDWFLAVASGSRSNRLADRALDLLCSTRANMARLQLGLGLPSRHLIFERGSAEADAKEFENFRARLAISGEEGIATSMSYKDILDLGAQDEKRQNEQPFYWLFRSGLFQYDFQARIWGGWLYRIARRWDRLRESKKNWRSGFDVYDDLQAVLDGKAGDLENRVRRLEDLESFKDFPKMCKRLVAELKQVSGDLPLSTQDARPDWPTT